MLASNSLLGCFCWMSWSVRYRNPSSNPRLLQSVNCLISLTTWRRSEWAVYKIVIIINFNVMNNVKLTEPLVWDHVLRGGPHIFNATSSSYWVSTTSSYSCCIGAADYWWYYRADYIQHSLYTVSTHTLPAGHTADIPQMIFIIPRATPSGIMNIIFGISAVYPSIRIQRWSSFAIN